MPLLTIGAFRALWCAQRECQSLGWQCGAQPLLAHSTPGVEPIAYCESLVVGKATEALLCCSNTFDRVIYGDNAAAIGLAHGVTTSSWRARHLRVKVSVWREALRDSNINPGGCLKLLHLQSTELVADGCTKPLSGQAFFRFLEETMHQLKGDVPNQK